MQLYGLLAFLYSRSIVALAHARGSLVGAYVHGQQAVVVIAMTINLCILSLLKSHLSIIHYIIMGRQGMIETCHGRVLLC